MIKQAWIDLFGPEVVWELYGGTELQALTFISGDQWLTHRGSVGTVVARRDEGARRRRQRVPTRRGRRDLHAASAGQRAHLPLHRRDRQSPATAGTRSAISDYFDEDGYLYLNDRRVDMFTVGGRNVYPAEIEGRWPRIPDVLSCLVVGVPRR